MSAKSEEKDISLDSKAYSKKESSKDSNAAKEQYDEEEEIFYSDYKGDGDGNEGTTGESKDFEVPQIEVLSISASPTASCPVNSPLSLDIRFELDRDAVAAFWSIRFLVDSCHSRVIKILGETPVEDYPDGESEMHFQIDEVNVDDIEPSTLANSGLLMAVLMVNGEEVASVNMVVQVYKKDGILVREILNPLD